MTGARVLVAEDDDTLRRAVSTMLRREGFEVADFAHGHELPAMLAFRADLAVLDVMLPGCDGFTIAQHLCAEPDTRVLFLTARSGLDDRLASFEIGAEDYVVKPVALPELLARVRVILRRDNTVENERVIVGDLEIDFDATIVTQSCSRVDLTATEFKLMSHLVRHAGRTVAKLQLLTHVWGYDAYDPNLVEVHISALRRKFDPTGPQYITTVRGLGYHFDRVQP